MAKPSKSSTLLQKYLDLYKKNPRSRVFAPLAECYRKLGMLDDALKVLRDGIRYNPTYTLGYLVLGQCYADMGKTESTYETLRPFIESNRDNLMMQKLYAESCLKLGFLEESLEAYKFLLYLNPRDKEFQDRVKLLEDDLMVQNRVEYSEYKQRDSVEDDWSQLDLNLGQNIKESDESEWVQIQHEPEKTIPEELKFVEKKSDDATPIKVLTLDDLEESVGYQNTENIIPIFEEKKPEVKSTVKDDLPMVMTLTLVDIFCSQGHSDKACEILEKILEVNPENEKALKKLSEIQAKMSQTVEAPQITAVEEGLVQEGADVLKNLNVSKYEIEKEQLDAHTELLDFIENNVKKRDSHRPKRIEAKLTTFLDRLKVVSNTKLSFRT